MWFIPSHSFQNGKTLGWFFEQLYVPNHPSRKCMTFQDCCHGFHHQTPLVRWIQHHPYNHWHCVTFLGTWPIFSFLFLTIMYLYDHLILIHMTDYLYNRATLSGTLLFPPFVWFLLFSLYSSLWPPLFVSLLFCDSYCLWPHCSLLFVCLVR